MTVKRVKENCACLHKVKEQYEGTLKVFVMNSVYV